jgi:hypothetical protein
MKHVFSNHEIPHLWAHQTQSEARNAKNSFYFDGDTIYSYGSHFPIARIVTNERGDRAILVTNRSYSVTTSRHVSRVRAAIPSSTRKFFVRDPSEQPSATFKREFPTDIRAALERAATANKRNRPKHLATATEVHARALEFAEFFGLDASTLPAIPDTEDVARVVSEWQAAELVAREKREAEYKRQQSRETAKQLRQFRNGDSRVYVRMPYGSAALRIDGDEVVTSLGARFPISHARKGLYLIRAVMLKGEEWRANGHTIHLGHYTIDRIEANGTVHAGCHVVTFAEISRIAPQLESSTQEVA